MSRPAVFDAAAFVADLMAAGYGVSAYYDVPRGGKTPSEPRYMIRPPRGCGFAVNYPDLMARWGDAIEACPDHVERVVAYVFECGRAAHEARS